MPSRRRKVLNGVLLFGKLACKTLLQKLVVTCGDFRATFSLVIPCVACFCSFCVPKIFGSDGCTVGQEQFDCPFGQTCLDKKCG